MTEESFQAARKIMQTANVYRGYITTAKGAVSKWTKLEDFYRRELRHDQAEGAKKMLDESIKRLNTWREKFAAIKFPDDDIEKKKESGVCSLCGVIINIDATYCENCINPAESKK